MLLLPFILPNTPEKSIISTFLRDVTLNILTIERLSNSATYNNTLDSAVSEITRLLSFTSFFTPGGTRSLWRLWTLPDDAINYLLLSCTTWWFPMTFKHVWASHFSAVKARPSAYEVPEASWNSIVWIFAMVLSPNVEWIVRRVCDKFLASVDDVWCRQKGHSWKCTPAKGNILRRVSKAKYISLNPLKFRRIGSRLQMRYLEDIVWYNSLVLMVPLIFL